MSFKRILVFTAAIVLFITAGALAKSPGKTGAGQEKKTPFQKMDKNSDGKVSKDEFSSYFKDRFATLKGSNPEITVESLEGYFVALYKDLDKSADARLDKAEHEVLGRIDKNGDGVITPDEWNAFFVERIKVMDKDKNGKITEEEYDIFYNVNFKALDTNGDGVVTVEEWIANVPKATSTDPKPKERKPLKKTSGK